VDDLSPRIVVAIAGFVAGAAFGALAQRTGFCAMGGVSDRVLMGDSRRLRAWLLAAAVAILGTQSLAGLGLIELPKAIYQTPNLGWFGAIAGGLAFGFGMVLTGGCGQRTLVRLGAGNLRSIVVLLVLAVTAYMTLRGLVAAVRVPIEGAVNLDLRRFGLQTQGLADLVIRPVATIAVAGALLAYCLVDPRFRRSPRDIVAGLGVGALIVAGWATTGILGRDEFEPQPLASFTFVAPVADSLQYLMTFTGAKISFGVATVGGVLLGAFVAAKAGGDFRLEAFSDRADLLRHLGGATLMGVGGVFALGCTIGQGVTGVSTLALGSFLALAAIIAGAVGGVKYLERFG
jgi:uncharacterized membrane protein YedE/YeeE